ncbi:unnamed protein product [Rhizophagus irregularis]|nr:unnamed protein product [Rhizophagus irregularis]
MAAERNHIREDLRTFGNIMLGHDIGNDWNALVPPADTIFGRINQVETRVGNLAGPVNRAAKMLDKMIMERMSKKISLINHALKEDYEDNLVKDMEKMKIYMLGKLQNIESKCHRKGHFATRCPLGNNIRRNERRVNLMDTGNYGRDDEYEEYEESDDNYDYEYEEYDDPQLYSYERDLYEKDNPVQERRISNRINPVQGWKNFGKPNLDKDIVERGKEDYKYRNREETPMEEEEDEQLMYDRPIGPDNTNIPKRYKWSKKRGEYYNTMEGINRWKETGGKCGPRKDNIVGVKSKDPVIDYGNLLNIVEQQGKMIKRML